MNAQTKVEAGGLSKLREPFPPHQISKLPKPSKAQTEAVRADFKKGVRCKECGAWHHPEVVHLDYVGHAALTDRLLDTDPNWSWEPVAFREGLPAFDATGGLWIKLTVCGVTRLGYGHAATKNGVDPGAREKEVIGDALRNAAMRFGAALDLWHKGDLHVDEKAAPAPQADKPTHNGMIDDAQFAHLVGLIESKGADTERFCKWLKVDSLKELPSARFGEALTALRAKPDKNPQHSEIIADEIPY